MEIDNISLQDCQLILNKASDSSLHENNFEHDGIPNAVEIIRSMGSQITEVSRSKHLLVKCAASCIWIFKTSFSLEDCIDAFSFYLTLSKSPLFGSLGCRSLGIRKFLFHSFSRVMLKTLKGTSEISAATKASMEIDEEDDEFAIEIVSESQSNQRPRRAVSQAPASLVSKKSKGPNNKPLQTFVTSLNDNLAILLENADEDFVSTVAESLVMLVQIAVFTEDWKSSSQAVIRLFNNFAGSSSETVLGLHQCVMPGLSYCFDRSAFYTDSSKLRSGVHSSLVEVYCPMTEILLGSVYKSSLPRSKATTTLTNVSFDTSVSGLETTSTTPAKSRKSTPRATPGSARSMKSVASTSMDVDQEETNEEAKNPKEFSTGQECLLSALQRMTLLCPDRANVRQVVAKSIGAIINAIVKDKNRVIANKILAHYLQFLTRLARSQRAQHRSFALEIICNMIQDEQMWSSGLDSHDLLLVLISRSADQSPVVRLKALSTIYDFLTGAEDTARLQTLYDLVMGTARGSNGISLLDTVRNLTTETKPMLRAKALQVLTCILTKEWVRPMAVTELTIADAEPEYFKLTLMEEDLQAIVSACSDPSIAVRKQAVHCLSEVLKAHPLSTSAITTWVMVALPLIIDTEATVVQKVASVFEDIVLQGLTEDVTTAELSLGWKVLYKIGESNMIQILKHIVGYMIRQGIIIFERQGQLSFYRLINMCKIHCEAGLAYQSSQNDSIDGNTTINTSTSTAHAFVNNDQVYYEASWILLEAFASHCALKVNNAKGQLISVEEQFQKVGSTKFVFDAFRVHCSVGISDANEHKEDNYLRILKVLDKFLATFSDEELSFVAHEIKTRLISLSVQSPVAALMISIQYQISKLRADQSTSAQNMLVTHITAWVTPLLEKIFQQLKNYAFGQSSSNHNVSLSQLSQQESFLERSNEEVDQQQQQQLVSMRTVQMGLFIIGELSMLGFKVDETPLKMLMKSTNSTENDQNTPLVTVTQDTLGSIRVRFASRLSEMLQLFMAKTLPGNDGQGHVRCPLPIRAVAFITVGKLCMRDHILARDSLNVFLRELTYEDEFANVNNTEMSMSALSDQSFMTQPSPITKNSVRNNALLVLADLCVRHTHLVDRHIDTLACCLQDRDVMIRKNALILISQLLMQDFVKLKGLLLYRFLMLTVDEDEELALFAQEVIERSLCVKYPGILVSHFSEALIILNKCSEHPIYSAVAFAAGQDNGLASSSSIGGLDDHVFSQAFAMDASALDMDPHTKAFHSSADLSRAQRFQIFNFMANNISDETKIQITAKMVNDILASAVDHSQRLLPDRNNIIIPASAMKKYGNNQRDSFGGLPSSSASNKSLIDLTRFETAIEDVFIFLRSPVLKIGAKKKAGSDHGEDAMLEENGEGSAAATTAGQIAQAKTKILKALSSQHMISHVLPVVMSLKHVLEQVKSPLQGALMEYLLHLVKHHASEVEQALQYDPTLKAEIEFDLRQFERQRKEQLQQQQSLKPASAVKNMPTPHLDRVMSAMNSASHLVRPSTVQKPVLKSVHKASLHNTAIKSSERKLPGSVRFHESVKPLNSNAMDEEDPMLRVMSQPEDIALDEFIGASNENISLISHRLSTSGRDLSNISILSDSGVSVDNSASLSRGNSAQKRRSWGVVLTNLSGSRKGSMFSSEDNFADNLNHNHDEHDLPARKRSRTHSRPTSLGAVSDQGDEKLPLSAQSHKSVSSTSATSMSLLGSNSRQQPVFLAMKTSASSLSSTSKPTEGVMDGSVSLPKKLDNLFAVIDGQDASFTSKNIENENTDVNTLMPPPPPIAGGKRSAKVASNSLMMTIR